MNTRTRRALLLACSAALCSGAATAQDINTNSESSSEIEEILVVGSRAPGRSAEDSPVPVDVLTADDLVQSGTIGGEIGSLLQSNIPSFNMSRQSNSDQADIVRAAQLRGLNPDQLLVLVNGKRRHANSVISVESKLGKGAAPVDFNNIPTSAIERIEVLRDGAAAQYGSDAIAGVINIVLKQGSDGGNVSASYGGHITSLDVINDDITDGQTATISFNKGFSLGDGFVNVSGEYRDRSATNRAGFDQLPTIGFAEFLVPVPSTGTPEAAPNDAVAGQRNYRMGDSESQDLNLSFTAGLVLDSDFELYGFGTYSDREAEGSNFFRYPVSDNNVAAIHPNGFLPTGVADVTDFSLAGGIKGELSGWTVDGSLVFGQNTFDDNLRNSVNSSLGATSPTSFNRAEYEYSQMVINLDASKGFEFGGSPVNFATGLEFRGEDYQSKAGDQASYLAGTVTVGEAGGDARIGAQGGAGLQPDETVDVDRNSFAIFVDAEFEITEAFLLSAAVRYEDFDDFGDTTNGKLAARWEIANGFALRGAVSTGFRAPSLAQAYFSGSSNSFGPGGALISTVNLPTSDPLAQANGAVDLEPEESDSRSLGFTWSNDAFNISFDYYQVDIDDRITLGGTLPVVGVPGVEGIRFFSNAIDTETKGFDLVASYTLDQWNFSAAYNDSDTDIVNSPAGFSVEEVNTLETAAPENKIILSSTWANDWVSVLVRGIRYGETQRIFDFGGGFEPTQNYSEEWSIDTDVQFNITDAWSVAVGANNLLDEYPDESIFDISFFGNLPYDGGISPLGVNGRFVYVRSSFDF